MVQKNAQFEVMNWMISHSNGYTIKCEGERSKQISKLKFAKTYVWSRTSRSQQESTNSKAELFNGQQVDKAKCIIHKKKKILIISEIKCELMLSVGSIVFENKKLDIKWVKNHELVVLGNLD